MYAFGWWEEAKVPRENPLGEHANSTQKGPGQESNQEPTVRRRGELPPHRAALITVLTHPVNKICNQLKC